MPVVTLVTTLPYGRQQRSLRPVEQAVRHVSGCGEEHFLHLGIVLKELVDPAGDRRPGELSTMLSTLV